MADRFPVIEEVHGPGDQPGGSYVSRRRPGAARTTVTEADKPRLLMTTTEDYFGLRFDVISSLTPQSAGTVLGLHVETHWPSGLGLLGRLVEAAILSPRDGRKVALDASRHSSRATSGPRPQQVVPNGKKTSAGRPQREED
jgi:hypothetical protein